MKSKCFRITFLFPLILILFASVLLIILNSRTIKTNSSNINKDITLIIDAGHGGEDGGAIASDGSFEKDYNLDIALRLEQILKIYGYNVLMTRTDDTMTCNEGLETQREKKISDIRNRMKIINSSENPVFISIHQNKFSDSNQKGAQVFYSKNNLKSKILADEIQKSFASNLQINNKRITKPSGTEIYLLYHSTAPSVLVECGFLSNQEDLSNLKDEQYRTQIAIVISDGIIKFLS